MTSLSIFYFLPNFLIRRSNQLNGHTVRQPQQRLEKITQNTASIQYSVAITSWFKSGKGPWKRSRLFCDRYRQHRYYQRA
jgi:hypothetical protein